MRSVWLHDPKTTIVFMRIQTDTVEQPAHEAPIEYVLIVDRLGLNQAMDPTITTRLVCKRVPCASNLMKKPCQRHYRPRG